MVVEKMKHEIYMIESCRTHVHSIKSSLHGGVASLLLQQHWDRSEYKGVKHTHVCWWTIMMLGQKSISRPKELCSHFSLNACPPSHEVPLCHQFHIYHVLVSRDLASEIIQVQAIQSCVLYGPYNVGPYDAGPSGSSELFHTEVYSG